jgi:hypothetical protein
MDSVAPVRYPQNAIQRPATNNWLDRPLLDTVTLDCEKALYALFILLALLSRLWDLGQRVMSHDETVHGQWSWYLYQGHGYAHHPLSHGPFLFHSTALTYYLFGDSEFTARLVPALMGVMLVALPYTLRRWLGRSGALVAAFLLLISPSLLYYSRYARNDVPIIVWSAIAVVAILRYLEASQNRGPIDRRSRWLIVLAASLVLMFATKEVAFFYIAIFGSFLVVLFFVRLGKPRRGTPSWEQWARIWLTVGGLVVVILVATGLLLSSFFLVELFPMRYRDCGQAPVPDVASGEMRCSEGGCRLIQGRCQRPLPIVASEDVFEFDQTGARVAIRLTQLEILIVVVLIGAIAVLAGGGAYAVLKRVMPLQPPSPGSPSTSSGRLASPSTGSGRGPSTGSGRGPSTGLVQHPERSEWAGGERPVLGLILFIGSFTLPFLSHLAISGLSRLYSRLLFGIDAAFNSLD